MPGYWTTNPGMFQASHAHPLLPPLCWLASSLSLHTFLFRVPGETYFRDFLEALFFCLESSFLQHAWSNQPWTPWQVQEDRKRCMFGEHQAGWISLQFQKEAPRTAEKDEKHDGVWVLTLRLLHGPCASQGWRRYLSALSPPSIPSSGQLHRQKRRVSLLDSRPHHSLFMCPWAPFSFCSFVKFVLVPGFSSINLG